MKKLPLLFLIAFLANSYLFAQIKYDERQLSAPIQELALEIADYNILNGAAVGDKGQKTDQYQRYERLCQEATNEELKNLTAHPHAVVRCYAFKALVYKKDEAVREILFRHLVDNERFVAMLGQVNSHELAGDYFIQIANQAECEEGEEPFILTVRDKATIDSILLYNPRVRLHEKNKLLRRLIPKAIHYSRVREVFVDENNKNALVSLAKYHKEEDKPFIIDFLKDKNLINNQYGLLATAQFPASEFFPLVEKIHSREIKKSSNFDTYLLEALYKAIVRYKNEGSVALIDKTLSKAHKNASVVHQEFIWEAIKHTPDPIFDKYNSRAAVD